MAEETQSKVEKEIAKLVRKGYGDRKDEEMRIDVQSFNGKPYVSLRLWWQTPEGEFAPSKKGMSIRVGELTEVIDALHKCEEALFKLNQGKGPAQAQAKPKAGGSTRRDPAIRADGTIDPEDVF